MNFPDTLPADCPLSNAVDCQLMVYMAFKTNQPSASDCKSQAERGRAKDATGDDACKRHGISVFPTYESCKHQISLFPRLGPFIGEAELSPRDGKIAETDSAKNPRHMTWWPCKEVDRHELFSNFVQV